MAYAYELTPRNDREVGILFAALFGWWNSPVADQRNKELVGNHFGCDHLAAACLRLAHRTIELVYETVDIGECDGVFAYDYCELDSTAALPHVLLRWMDDDEWIELATNYKLPENLDALIKKWARDNNLPLRNAPKTKDTDYVVVLFHRTTDCVHVQSVKTLTPDLAMYFAVRKAAEKWNCNPMSVGVLGIAKGQIVFLDWNENGLPPRSVSTKDLAMAFGAQLTEVNNRKVISMTEQQMEQMLLVNAEGRMP